VRLLLLAVIPSCAVSTNLPGARSEQPSAAPPAAAEPAPPPGPYIEAHHDSFGNLIGPGGDPSSAATTCDAAHDHCLRPETWFVSEWDGRGVANATPTYRFEDAFHDWRRGETPPGSGHRTEPATAASVQVGAPAVMFDSFDFLGAPPTSEDDALTATWQMGTVEALDAATGKLRFAGEERWIPLAVARVVVESR